VVWVKKPGPIAEVAINKAAAIISFPDFLNINEVYSAYKNQIKTKKDK
jgi:hypothetical protein